MADDLYRKCFFFHVFGHWNNGARPPLFASTIIDPISLFLHLHKDVTSYPRSAENDDFTPVLRTVEFAIGVSELPIDVEIISDDVLEDDEFFVLQLSNPIGGSVHPFEGETTIFIKDNNGESGVFILVTHYIHFLDFFLQLSLCQA